MTFDDELPDERLELVLGSLAADLDVTRRSAPRRWPIAAAVIVAVIVSTMTVAPVRRTVAQWARLGSTEVTIDERVELPPPGPLVDGPSLTRRSATELLGRPLPDLSTTTLGEPDGWHAAPDDGVVAVWQEQHLTLWLSTGLAETGPARLMKIVADEDQVRRFDDREDRLGRGGIAVAGDHVLTVPGRERRAATTVLWLSGDGTLFARLEHAAPGAADETAGAIDDDEVQALVELARRIETHLTT